MFITIGGETFRIKYTEDAAEIDSALSHAKPEWFTYDTETTGLHLKKDKAFMGGVCWDGVVYLFPTNWGILQHMPKWSKHVQKVFGHNITFDMHMTANATGDEKLPLRVKNWSDTMALARLSFEAISERDGGHSLKLKYIGKTFIDKTADEYEQKVKAWLSQKKKNDFHILVALLQGMFGKKGWGATIIQKMVDGKIPTPEEAKEIIATWCEEYPEPTYQDVPNEIMHPYLAVDVILTHLLVKKCLPVIKYREQEPILEREDKLIPVVYKMARPGIACNMDYLYASRDKMVDYIDRTRKRMWEIAGEQWGEFTCNQHALIKKIYTERLGEVPKSTDKAFLLQQIDKGDELAKCISKLRRLEKWLSTYIDRIIEIAEYDGRFYSGMNAFNPVSGRFSGDAQQFPKERILTEAGEELEKQHKKAPIEEEIFYPRRAFVPDEGQSIYYLDYSQVELRVQGHYTIYYGGEVNLCRAYMPFQCRHYLTGETYDFQTDAGRKRWSELKPGAPTDLHWEDQLKQGWSAWINPETGESWKPTDVHSATSLRALVVMGKDIAQMTKDELKYWRGKGKTFNFMRNYGGGDQMAAETLQISLEAAKAMNKGYTDAFPMVVTYQKGVERAMYAKGFVVNMFKRRYYVSDSRSYYKCANYLIQGGCADFLKEKMILIDAWMEENNIQSKMILCVHDELQFAIVPGEEWIISIIKDMMEDAPWSFVPIVAEVEKTTTTWAQKEKVMLAA